MLQDILIISLWGGVIAMDTTAAMQIMLSRPLVSCTVTGLILGNLPLGFAMGVLLELIYINEFPIGAAKFAEGNIGSSAAAAIAILVLRSFPERIIIIIAFALISALTLSSLGGYLVERMRRVNSLLYNALLDKAHLFTRDINRTHAAGIGLAFFMGFIFTLFTVYTGAFLLITILKNVPSKFDDILYPIQGGLLAVGTVFLLHLFLTSSKKKWMLLLGVVAGTLLLFLN